MTKSKTQRIIAILLAVAAVALIVLGIIHMPQREAQGGRDILDALRIRTLLNATGEGVVESYVAIAKQEASDKAREEGLGMSALREAVAKAEEEARAQHTGTSVDYDTVNTDVLVPALEAYTSALSAYYRAADAAEQAYIQEHLPEAEAAAEAEREAKLAAGQEVSEDEEVTVDMSGFVATEEMTALMVQADEAYLAVGEALKGIYPTTRRWKRCMIPFRPSSTRAATILPRSTTATWTRAAQRLFPIRPPRFSSAMPTT